jgi:hypothetical protein
MKRREMRGMV